MTNSAMLLYGLIHARYILTSHGLSAMHKKYQQACFGKCPRFLCASQSVVPVRVGPCAAHVSSPRSCCRFRVAWLANQHCFSP